jgi:hypothetical protein
VIERAESDTTRRGSSTILTDEDFPRRGFLEYVVGSHNDCLSVKKYASTSPEGKMKAYHL